MLRAPLLAALLAGCAASGLDAPREAADRQASARQSPDAALEAFPAHPNREIVVRVCAACHPPELVVAKRRTAAEWDRIVATMMDRGAVATADEELQIVEYLVSLFGPAPAASPPE